VATEVEVTYGRITSWSPVRGHKQWWALITLMRRSAQSWSTTESLLRARQDDYDSGGSPVSSEPNNVPSVWYRISLWLAGRLLKPKSC